MRLLLIAGLIVASSATLTAQTAAEELVRLKAHLGISQETSIALAAKRSLPGTPTLRVFIATGLDALVRDRFLEWIEAWNKRGEGKKYGYIEAVGDIAQADVILSRYTLAESETSSTYSVVLPGTVYDPAKNRTVTAPVARTYSYDTVPLYSYILKRSPGGMEILYRYVSRTSPGEFRSAGFNIRDEFKKLMKQRLKK
jgi:hypothetical protein